MNPKKCIILLIALAVLAGLAYLSRRPNTSKKAGLHAGDTILNTFDANLVTQLELRHPQGTNTLKRINGIWTVSNLHGYPANFDMLAQQIRTLLNLKAGQIIRNGSQYLDEFDLGTNAKILRLTDDAGTELAKLSLGKTRGANQNPYGGTPGEIYVLTTKSDVALINNEINSLLGPPESWVTTTLLNISPSQLTHITIASNKTSFTLNINPDQTYHIDKLKKKQEVNIETAGRLARALQHLNFSTVIDPNIPDAALGLDNPVTFTATARDGFTYTLKLGTSTPQGTPLHLNVQYTAPDDLPEEKKTLAQEKQDQLKRHTTWHYLIPPYNAEAMTMARHQLIKKKEPKDPKEEK